MQGHIVAMKPVNKKFLLLMGLMREQRHWGDFPGALQTRFPDAEIITPDIPGNGRHYRICSPDSIEKITDSVRQELAVTRDCSQINLIGLSMGGMSAIDWMIRYPEDISSAVLINTSARPHSPFFHRLRWQCYLSMLRLVFQKPEQQEKTLLYLLSNQHHDDTEILQNWRSWRRQYPVSPKSFYHQLLATTVFNPPKKPQHPLLTVASKADHLVDYRCSVALHRAWKTTYLEHPAAGHNLPLDDPDWLADKISNWYSRFQ